MANVGSRARSGRVARTRTVPAEIAADVHKLTEADAVRRWRTGQLRAAERQRVLVTQQGPRPAQAAAESLSALSAMDLWPILLPPWPQDQLVTDLVTRRLSSARCSEPRIVWRQERRCSAGRA